jgi:hypothetical protein
MRLHKDDFRQRDYRNIRRAMRHAGFEAPTLRSLVLRGVLRKIGPGLYRNIWGEFFKGRAHRRIELWEAQPEKDHAV